ncbi:MAG: hypothetical protein AAB448_00210 [Patescibacteria group bacterium]
MMDPIFTAVRSVINRIDPIGIFYGHQNLDEYDAEVGQILLVLSRTKNQEELSQKILEIFVKSFDEKTVGDKNVYERIAKDIWQLKTMIDASKDFPDLKHKPLVALSSSEVVLLKKELVAQALEMGKEYSARLDFSPESIKEIDRVLEDIHQNYAPKATEDELFAIARPFGCYILEVFVQQKIEGKFSIETFFNPAGDFAFTFKDGNTVFPAGWCFKRVADGDNDNLWMKYRYFVLHDLPTTTAATTQKSWWKRLFRS